MPAALDVDWEVIEKAAIQGVEYSELSEKFGIPEGAIRRRSSRYGWAVTFRRGPKNPVSQIAVTKAQNEAVSVLKQASLSQIGERHPLKLARFVEGKINEAIEGDLIPAPETAKDLATMDTILRRAVGLDKPSPVVSLSLFGSIRQIEAETGDVINLDVVEDEPSV